MLDPLGVEPGALGPVGLGVSASSQQPTGRVAPAGLPAVASRPRVGGRSKLDQTLANAVQHRI